MLHLKGHRMHVLELCMQRLKLRRCAFKLMPLPFQNLICEVQPNAKFGVRRLLLREPGTQIQQLLAKSRSA
jgi:hypothetical protein